MKWDKWQQELIEYKGHVTARCGRQTGKSTCVGKRTAQNMINSWGQRGLVYAGLNLGLDYLFLFVYACAIGLGCVLVARSYLPGQRFLANLGILIAWAQLGAALLDCVENYALIQVLFGTENAAWPAVARWCAFPKFSIVGAGLIYVIAGTIVVVVLKVKKRDESPA